VARALVTGAAGLVGTRVVRQLLAVGDLDWVVAVDRAPLDWADRRLVAHRLDLARADLAPVFDGVDVVVHLAEAGPGAAGARRTVELAERVLEASDRAGVGHVVLLSSAMVYGARPDNPVPLTEAAPVRPEPGLAYAVVKAELEARFERWAGLGADRTLSVLRPTTALSEAGASWVARTLRAATAVRPDQVDPPVQFLHVTDLASAVVVAVRRRLSGPFNVAPDGWLGPDRFRALDPGPRLRLPDPLADRLLRVRSRVGLRPVPAGILPYVRHPWVVANDRLRAEGWVPAFTNEEAYVAGTPAPLWASVSPKQRQELALAAAGVLVLAAVGGAVGLLRRLTR
jgi:nucleoside-diphosphate-sugar epimerase